ncbi:MAG: hypothetical protein M3Y39_03850 [Chloroflexota bacterium]|nr:hypothetical protein [Chloroflexota bacterium]
MNNVMIILVRRHKLGNGTSDGGETEPWAIEDNASRARTLVSGSSRDD